MNVADQFAKDTAAHRMEILRDDGLYRHLRFSRPGTWSYGFDLTTWPGHLCISGDMGCYVFSRLPDMFRFFREGGGRDGVNLGYWAEKVQALDRCCGVEEFSPERFRAAIERRLADRFEDEPMPEGLRAAVVEDVLSRADDGEHEAMRAAMEFGHEGFGFADFWEAKVRDYTHRFRWCCHAIAWGVRTYDEARFSD